MGLVRATEQNASLLNEVRLEHGAIRILCNASPDLTLTVVFSICASTKRRMNSMSSLHKFFFWRQSTIFKIGRSGPLDSDS